MKSFFLILSLLWIGKTFTQGPNHFLIKSNSPVNITDPICKKMAENAKMEIQEEIKRVNKKQKKGEINLKKMRLEEQSYFEAIQTLGNDPENNFVPYILANEVIRPYRQAVDEPIYLSLQKVTLTSLGAATLEISINDIQVSSSESAMDVVVKSLKNPSTPAQTIHFSCPTGRILLEIDESRDLVWLNFWGEFFKEVKVMEQLEKVILQLDPSLISKAQRDLQSDEKISKLGLTGKEYLNKCTEQAKRILKELPYNVPFNEIVAVLISQDEQKLSLLTYHQYPSELFYDEVNDEVNEENSRNIEMTKWNFEKKDGQWAIYYSDEFIDSMDHIRSFYLAGFDSENRFKEETWIEHNNLENISGDFLKIELVREASSPEIEFLVRTEIQPKLAKLLSEKGSSYVSFYQRISPQYSNYHDDQEIEEIYFQDVLISNPEKTAFIFPVLLTMKESDEFEPIDEVFKFYVLLKNSDGSYKLYDWYYFKPFSYWGIYSLLRCAETHLSNISTYTSDQKVINDQAFWDNYIFKRSNRGFDYLTEVVLSNESISITKSEFDATVQDCIDLLLEHDLKDLYDHQLKQIIRCINTIQIGNLSGAQNLKLVTLSQELYFKKRLNKIKKAENNYYPELNIELGMPLNKCSYYQFH